MGLKKLYIRILLLSAFIFCFSELSAQTAETAPPQKENRKIVVDVPDTASCTKIELVLNGSKTKANEKSESSVADSKKTKGENVLDEDAFEGLAVSPVSTIWGSFKAWISRHIKIDDIEAWKVFYLFVGIFLTLIIARTVRWGIENHMMRLSKKTTTEIDDRIWEAVGRPASLFINAVGFYLSTGPMLMHFSPGLKSLYGRICLAVAASAIAWAVYRMVSVIDYILTKLAEKTDNNLDDLIVAVIRKSLKVTILVISVLFIGQNILNLNITAFLAGAGVIGLAIAFAAQDTIANFFGSIMVILDQPFKVGEYISLQGTKGIVENVGFRSTRIRTLDGHMVSLPNKGVANETIENIARRPYMKKVINLGLTYDTGYKNMLKAVDILHDILDKQPCMHPDLPPRIAFDAFNDFSLNICVTLWWHDRDDKGNWIAPDYWRFMDWVHKTDMEILKRFDEAGLEFAFPTNTTYLAYDEKRKLTLNINQES